MTEFRGKVRQLCVADVTHSIRQLVMTKGIWNRVALRQSICGDGFQDAVVEFRSRQYSIGLRQHSHKLR